MAQTTNGMTFKDNKLEISTNGSAWTEISGHSNKVTVDGGERANEELFTFDGDTPIIGVGKRSKLEVTIGIVYTEEVADAQEIVRGAYEAGSSLYARWTPAGGTAGDFVYTTAPGVVVTNPYPGGEAESAEIMAAEFKLVVPSITKSVQA